MRLPNAPQPESHAGEGEQPVSMHNREKMAHRIKRLRKVIRQAQDRRPKSGKLEICCPTGSASTARIYLDGRDVSRITRAVTVRVRAGRALEAAIEIIPSEIAIDAELAEIIMREYEPEQPADGAQDATPLRATAIVFKPVGPKSNQ